MASNKNPNKENHLTHPLPLLTLPRFTPPPHPAPSPLSPLALRPLPPHVLSPTIQLAPQILSKLGVKDEPQSSLLSGLFNCSNCGGCSVLSRETLNQITEEDNEKDSRRHLEDKVRRAEYEKIWKMVKQRSVKLPKVSFVEFYAAQGQLQQEAWRQAVIQLYQ